MSANPDSPWTVNSYLAFERESEEKHEFVDGEVFPASGASRYHNLITGNTAVTLHNQLRKRSYEVLMSLMRVRIGAHFVYPDVVVVCDEPQLDDSELDTLLNPTLIIEVLSPSTEQYDRGRKFQLYRTLESLQAYVLIA
jgi:Uma2 family endonuclease